MKNSFYTSPDFPTEKENNTMWEEIESSLPKPKSKFINVHWRSFWIGNAAAVLILFASIGLFSTGKLLLENNSEGSSDEQVYETLSSASDQLKGLTPLLIEQATELNKSSIESTAMAIEEIDLLIQEIKEDMLINGASPTKRNNLKRLYATKLDFYKDLLLNEDIQS